MDTRSIRRLRSELASTVRRAASGERVVITVSGRPLAELGPVGGVDRTRSIEQLVASGAVLPPNRRTGWRSPAPVTVWTGVRIDRAVGEIRR